MVFEIEKKGHKFEIKPKMAGNKVEIMFKLDGETAWKGTSRYDEKSGVIYFIRPVKIGNGKIKGIKLGDAKIEQIKAWKEEEIKKYDEKLKELRKIRVKTFRWAVAADTNHVYVSTDEIENHSVKTDQLEEIEEAMKYIDLQDLAKISKKVKGPELNTINGNDWLEVSVDVSLIREAVNRLRRVKKEKAQKKVQNKKYVAAQVNKARITEEKQEITRYLDRCDEDEEECDWDIVTVWAMPDGSTRIERHHTW